MRTEKRATDPALLPLSKHATLHLAAPTETDAVEDGTAALPVAIAAITVAGQCRERSPADEALFGPGADRFVARFADRTVGQQLFATAVAEGIAEGRAVMLTAAGPLGARVSLWRQRGGDRVRLIAAVAVEAGETAAAAVAGGDTPHGRGALDAFGATLGRPLDAAIALANQLRGDGGAAVDDVIAVLWRARTLLQRGIRHGPGPLEAETGGDAEVDLAHLARRAMRVADPAAAARAVELVLPVTPAPAVVVGDQHLLWGLIDGLLLMAIATLPRGTRLVAELTGAERAVTLRLYAECRGPAPATDASGQRAEAERLAESAGLHLEIADEPLPFEARLTFPAERCLSTP